MVFNIMPAVTPALPENLNYIQENDIRSSTNNSASECVMSCSAIKFYWDPPNNHNETVIDHYELTIGTQHVTVMDTEWIFIPNMTDLLFLTELYNVSVLAVDICGQKGIPSILHMHKEDSFCGYQCGLCHTANYNSSYIVLIMSAIMISTVLVLCLISIYMIAHSWIIRSMSKFANNNCKSVES